MKKCFLSLSALLCLVHGQSIAQHPGDVRWSLLIDTSAGVLPIYSIKVQPDGKIVAAGNSSSGSKVCIAVGRYAGGKPDSSFGINGVMITSPDSAQTVANAVELQPDGKIVVAGNFKKGTDDDFVLARFNPDGRTDSSFGINGIVRTDIAARSFDAATALAIQTDGRIIAAGRSETSLALCRYNIDGSLDSSFDSDGKLTVTAAAGATCMKLQADGKMVICCGGVVIRLKPDGSLDSGFGANGAATLTYQFYNKIYGMAIQNDGKILLSGGGGAQFVLQRLTTAGLTDDSFGTFGIVTTTGFAPINHSMCATSVCVQADGRILAGGWVQYTLSVARYFAVARYQSNGAPDSSFGVYGKVAPYIQNFEYAQSFTAAINNNNELVLAGQARTANSYDFRGALASYYLGPMLGVHTVPRIGGQIIVTPNPAEDVARIQSAQVENGTWHLTLCDLTGKTIYSETVVITNNALDKSISLISLPAAMYLVKLDNGISRMTVKLAKSR